MDRQTRSDCGRHWLIDKSNVARASSACRVSNGAPFDWGNHRWHAHRDPRFAESTYANLLQDQSNHSLSGVEISNSSLAKGTNGNDVRRGPSYHLPCFTADGEDVTGSLVHRDNRRLVEHDAASTFVHQRVSGAQVDRKVTCQGKSSRYPVTPPRPPYPGHYRFEEQANLGVDENRRCSHPTVSACVQLMQEPRHPSR